MTRLERGLYWDRALTLVEGCGPGSFSPGCDNCWSREQTHVRKHQANEKIRARYEGLTDESGRWTGAIRLMHDAFLLPGKTKKPTRWAVWNDLFHPDVPDFFIEYAYTVFRNNPHHTFLVLTKQAERLYEWCLRNPHLQNESLKNVWLGITAENQSMWDIRSHYLKQIPAAVRWVSFEPLLGHIKTGNINWLHWMVVGGESGKKARPMHPFWPQTLHNYARAFSVPFFFKQWGVWYPVCSYYEEDNEIRDEALDNSHIFFTSEGCRWYEGDPSKGERFDGQPPLDSWIMQRMSKKAAGRVLEGKVWNELPEVG